MLSGAPRVEQGRIRAMRAGAGRAVVRVDGPAGEEELVVGGTPDRRAARMATAGLRRVDWVRIPLDDPAAPCELTGATRRPHTRRISLGAALSLAADGIPTFVTGKGH